MNKDLVVIVSGGRTGTRFFGERLGGLIENAFSVHEPDVVSTKRYRTFKHIADFGIWNVVLGRLLGRTGIRILSQKMLARQIALRDAKRWVQKARDRYYASISAELLIEANGQWFGALPALRAAYPHCKIVGIVRDPRTWVRSCLNHGGQHDEEDRFTRFGAKRLEPSMVGDTAYSTRWSAMGAFEKLCWDWDIAYRTIDAEIEGNANAAMFRYEDLFLAEERERHIRGFFEFVCDWPSRDYMFRIDDDLWSQPVHASRPRKLEAWHTWSTAEARTLTTICSGELIQKYGYCSEREWSDKLSQADNME